mmetsp:Transcript_11635/g.27132  ORF Transcript_11635/g.27132 Transcript_11635/m.27132 type:complete len:251 (+) Transcript_11635:793-1545(+)
MSQDKGADQCDGEQTQHNALCHLPDNDPKLVVEDVGEREHKGVRQGSLRSIGEVLRFFQHLNLAITIIGVNVDRPQPTSFDGSICVKNNIVLKSTKLWHCQKQSDRWPEGETCQKVCGTFFNRGRQACLTAGSGWAPRYFLEGIHWQQRSGASVCPCPQAELCVPTCQARFLVDGREGQHCTASLFQSHLSIKGAHVHIPHVVGNSNAQTKAKSSKVLLFFIVEVSQEARVRREVNKLEVCTQTLADLPC